MAKRKKDNQVRRSLMVDAEKLEKARKLLGAESDADALRLALDHVLGQVEGRHEEEE